MNYSVKNNELGNFDIVDHGSEAVILLSTNRTDASDICKKLNRGFGFGGFTPGFFASLKGHNINGDEI